MSKLHVVHVVFTIRSAESSFFFPKIRHFAEARLGLSFGKFLQELETTDHVAVGRTGRIFLVKFIYVCMVSLHLLEFATVGIVHKVKSVRPGRSETQNLVASIVFKHQMKVFQLTIFDRSRRMQVGLMLFAVLQFLVRIGISGRRYVHVALFHLCALSPNCAVAAELFAKSNFVKAIDE